MNRKTMNSQEKALLILKEDKIFKVSQGNDYINFKCSGSKREVYDIIYRLGVNKWSCTCKNIRFTPCSHILAGIKLMEASETQI